MITKQQFWASETKAGKKFLKELAETLGPLRVVAYRKPVKHEPFTAYRCYWKR